MTSCDVPWDDLKPETKNKLISSAENKSLSDFKMYPEIGAFVVKEREDFWRSLGCFTCLEGEKGQDYFGYITLGGVTLLNYKDLINEHRLPVNDTSTIEISTNVWICPICSRWILDYIPKYDTIPVGDIKCQPIN
jgi:hypothetical protein